LRIQQRFAPRSRDLRFLWHLAEGNLHKTLLFAKVLRGCPKPQDEFGIRRYMPADNHRLTVFGFGWLMRNFLRKCPQSIEGFWAALSIYARIPFLERF